VEKSKLMTLNRLIEVYKENGLSPDMPIICTADCDLKPLMIIDAVGMAISDDGDHDAVLLRMHCTGSAFNAEDVRSPKTGIDWNQLLRLNNGKGNPKS